MSTPAPNPHLLLPISTYFENRQSGYFDAVRHKLKSFENRENRLRGNLGEIDNCISEFSQRVDRVVRSLRIFEQRKLEELYRVRTEISLLIDSEIDHAKANLYRFDPPQLTSELAYCLLTSDDLDHFRLFEYDIESNEGDIDRIVRIAYTAGDRYCPISVLPQVSKRTLSLLDLGSKQTSMISLTKPYSKATFFSFIDSDSLLCIDKSNVDILCLSSGTIEHQFSLYTPRTVPACLKSGLYTYIFGGRAIDSKAVLKSCERFSICRKDWSPIADMHREKSSFSACLYGSYAYLPFPNHSLERFDTTRLKFTELDVSFPMPKNFFGLVNYNSEENSYVSFVFEGEIVTVMTTEQIARLKIGQESKFRVQSFDVLLERVEGGCATGTVRERRQVYWVETDTGQIRKFDMDRERISRVEAEGSD